MEHNLFQSKMSLIQKQKQKPNTKILQEQQHTQKRTKHEEIK